MLRFVRRLMFEQLPIDWLHFRRNAEIHILDRRVPYPIQYHLHALPDEARVQCLMSYIDTLGQRLTLEKLFVPVVDTKVEIMQGDSPEEQAMALARRLKEAKLI